MVRQTNRYSSVLGLVLLCAGMFACVIAPTGIYQTPDIKDRGGAGMAGGIGPLYAFNAGGWGFSNLGTLGIEPDFWLDFNISSKTDFRLRLGGLILLEDQDGYQTELLLPGIDLGFKTSTASRNLSWLYGFSLSAVLERREDGYSTFWGGMTPWFGVVYAAGDPGGVRFTFSPRLAVAAVGGQLALSLGLDIPLGDNLYLRPEAAGTCFISVFGFGLCGGGLGLAIGF